MKNITLLYLISFASIGFALSPASAAPKEHIAYCRDSNSADPICIDEAKKNGTWDDTKTVTPLTKEEALASRTKYCRNAVPDDPVCTKEMFNAN